MKRHKILHVQLFPMLSGVQRVSLEEFRRLDPAKFEAHLVTSEEGPLNQAVREFGVISHVIPELVRPVSPVRDYAAFRSLKSLMKRERYDIVHTHSSKTGVLGRLAAASAGVSAVVHTVHGFAFPAAKNRIVRWMYEAAEKRCMRCTDALICLNPADVQLSVGKLGFQLDKVIQIPNGVDTETFSPCSDIEVKREERKNRLPGDPSLPTVMMVGRLWGQKNPLAFVNAAIELLRQTEANFYLVGDGELAGMLVERIAAAAAGGNVHLLGWRDDVKDILPLTDVLVLPSLWEGMPLVLLEAQACGLPVVASDIPGNRDCVRDGQDGFLVDVASEGALEGAISHLLADADLRRSFGQAARQKVVSEFGIEARMRRVLAVYERLLGIERRGGLTDASQFRALDFECSQRATR